MKNIRDRAIEAIIGVLAILLASASMLDAQTPQIEWASQFGAITGGDESPADMDADGNIYLLVNQGGGWSGPRNAVYKYDASGNELMKYFPAETAHLTALSLDTFGHVYLAGITGAGIIVLNYDLEGNMIWSRQHDTSASVIVRAMCLDASGIYICGDVTGTLPGQTNAGGLTDAFACKCDLEGNLLWIHQFGTIGQDYLRDICMVSTGLFIAGYTYLSAPSPSQSSYLWKLDLNGNEAWSRQSAGSLGMAVKADSTFVYLAGHSMGSYYSDAYIEKYDFNGNELWTRWIGTPYMDSVGDIWIDGMNIYLAGTTSGIFPGQNHAGGTNDAFLSKFDSNGSALWTRQYGTSGNDYGQRIVCDADTIYISGQTTGVFEGATYSGGTCDLYIRKYDTNGDDVWTRQFGQIVPATIIGKAIDAYGNLYVSGYTYGTLPNYHQTETDCFLRKYTPNGNELWARQFGAGDRDQACGIATDASGIYVVGLTSGVYPGQASCGSQDAFLRKYDFDGNELWTRQFGTSRGDNARSISIDVTGIYIAGETDGTFPNQTGSGSIDVFVRKWDFDGGEIWTRQFGSPAYDFTGGITCDPTGVYISGSTDGALPGQTTSGNRDGYLKKYDFAGNELWTRQFGTVSWDYAYGICADTSGVYVSGQSGYRSLLYKFDAIGNNIWTRISGPVGAEGIAVCTDATGIYLSGTVLGVFPGQTSAGMSDIFVQKYDPEGNLYWTIQFGTSEGDVAADLCYMSGGLYITGYTNGVFPGQSGDGGTDAFIVKISINAPPVANAGPDQTVEGAGPTTSFTLDGAASGDPEGAALTYNWTDEAGNVVGTGPAVTLNRTLATYTFTLTVADPEGLSATDTIVVTIHDTTPPAITGLADVTVDQSDPYLTPVSLVPPTVTDLCDPNPTVTKITSGPFPLGETIVTWTATDASGNVATAQQKVTVVSGSPANQLSNLTKLIEYSVAAGAIDPELETSLLAKVAAAMDAIAKANASAATVAMNDLKALVNQVEAQTDKKITPEIAAEIIAWANRVITDLGS